MEGFVKVKGRMVIEKDAEATLDYLSNWTEWLNGDTIVSHTVTVVSGSVVLDSSSEAGGVVTAWLSGGTLGEECKVTYAITTQAGRHDERTIYVRIVEK